MRTLPRLRPALTLVFALVVTPLTTSHLAVNAQTAGRERTLFVSAVNDKGEPVQGLGPDAFVVREDGVRREVLRVSTATEPIDIALLVDNSAAAQDEIPFLREALSKFVARMAPGNQIAVVALADRPTVLVDYSSDAKRLSDATGRLFAQSGSGMTLLDALVELSNGLKKRETPRAAQVAVITDGPEFTNRYAKDIASALRDAQVALHLVTVGSFYHAEEHGIRERSYLLDQGPRASGGQHVTLLTPNGIDAALQKIANELKAQYKAVYGRSESLVPPDKIEVSPARTGVTMRGTPARGQTGA